MVMPGFPHAHKKPEVNYAHYPFYRWKHRGTQRLVISQLESGRAGTQPRFLVQAHTVTTWNHPSVMSPLKIGESLTLAVPHFSSLAKLDSDNPAPLTHQE